KNSLFSSLFFNLPYIQHIPNLAWHPKFCSSHVYQMVFLAQNLNSQHLLPLIHPLNSDHTHMEHKIWDLYSFLTLQMNLSLYLTSDLPSINNSQINNQTVCHSLYQ